MTTFVHVELPAQHPGVERAQRTFAFLGALSALGAPLVRRFEAWQARRREALSDAQYWNAALGDARIMADISRAMNEAGNDVQAYWPSRG